MSVPRPPAKHQMVLDSSWSSDPLVLLTLAQGEWPRGYVLRSLPYRIETKLGEGGFGCTYLAVDQRSQRQVAIKTIHPRKLIFHKISFATGAERFRQEALTQAQCNVFRSSHIVQVFDLLEERILFWRQPCIVLEYIPGKTLWTWVQELLQQKSYLSPQETSIYLQQLLSALGDMHGVNIFHRDIKPGNIQLDRQHQRAVLLDFGTAKQWDPSQPTIQHTAWYSGRFTCAEQYQGTAPCPHFDLYALCMSFLWAMGGDFPSLNPDADRAVIPPHLDCEGRALYAILLRGIAPRPQDRYQTVQALVDALRLSPEPIPEARLDPIVPILAPTTQTPEPPTTETQMAHLAKLSGSQKPSEVTTTPAILESVPNNFHTATPNYGTIALVFASGTILSLLSFWVAFSSIRSFLTQTPHQNPQITSILNQQGQPLTVNLQDDRWQLQSVDPTQSFGRNASIAQFIDGETQGSTIRLEQFPPDFQWSEELDPYGQREQFTHIQSTLIRLKRTPACQVSYDDRTQNIHYNRVIVPTDKAIYVLTHQTLLPQNPRANQTAVDLMTSFTLPPQEIPHADLSCP